jgi:type II secretory pathway pseudopilin PulG
METEPESNKKVKRLELAIIIALVGILMALFIRPTIVMFSRSRENTNLANLVELRSALTVYYADNQHYPTDDLTSLTDSSKYLSSIPVLRTDYHHASSNHVITASTIKDFGRWYYDNDPTSPTWGNLHMGCTHPDSKGVSWSTY